MTLAEFKAKAEKAAYNTTNGWGFGGDFGNVYTLDNLKFYDVKYSTRHKGTYANPDFWADGKRVATKKEFLTLIAEL